MRMDRAAASSVGFSTVDVRARLPPPAVNASAPPRAPITAALSLALPPFAIATLDPHGNASSWRPSARTTSSGEPAARLETHAARRRDARGGHPMAAGRIHDVDVLVRGVHRPARRHRRSQVHAHEHTSRPRASDRASARAPRPAHARLASRPRRLRSAPNTPRLLAFQAQAPQAQLIPSKSAHAPSSPPPSPSSSSQSCASTSPRVPARHRPLLSAGGPIPEIARLACTPSAPSPAHHRASALACVLDVPRLPAQPVHASVPPPRLPPRWRSLRVRAPQAPVAPRLSSPPPAQRAQHAPSSRFKLQAPQAHLVPVLRTPRLSPSASPPPAPCSLLGTLRRLRILARPPPCSSSSPAAPSPRGPPRAPDPVAPSPAARRPPSCRTRAPERIRCARPNGTNERERERARTHALRPLPDCVGVSWMSMYKKGSR
ncbi:hypothetical protein B0H15DRAFT_1026315 [Mycena belliarum]|uniref:Uncharacterized protein n=1 Tax=Mycena belliarum TaxID=1033014 RepID=A0AAD6XKP1_9AGAR|nr:hypothetical protein B0H15DRAFT_1026315 [Mycena belliae]